MDETIKINSLQKVVLTLTASLALKQLSRSLELSPVEKSFSAIDEAINKLDTKIIKNDLDLTYYFTTWENWQVILDCVYGILKWFPWTAEKFDCDQRSAWVTTTCGMLFGLNTCTGAWCEVYDANTGALKYLHWANIIIDEAGNTYLFDADNGGLKQKITSNNAIMGGNRYKFLSVRAF